MDKHTDFSIIETFQTKVRIRLISTQSGGSNRLKLGTYGVVSGADHLATPLSEEEAGDYKLPLEMVRLAPSARNSQPWRIVKEGDYYHFYYHPSLTRFAKIDMGIALCHFEQTCVELKMEGRYEVLPDMETKFGNKEYAYAVSWNSKITNE